MNRLIIIFLYIGLINCCAGYAQIYPVVGRYEGKLAQGMAIHKSKAFLMYDGGLCLMYDLKKKRIVESINLEMEKFSPHGNSACFGGLRSPESPYPLLYVSECKKNGYHCFVEAIYSNASHLVQTIEAKEAGKTLAVLNWCVDKRKPYLYGIVRDDSKKNIDGLSLHRIIKYRLPDISGEEPIILSEKDVISVINVYFSNLLQDCTIKGNYMYIAGGEKEADRKLSARVKQRAIVVVNLKKGILEKKIDLTDVTSLEPEGCDFYKKKLLLSCGQDGGIYEIKEH